MTDPYRGFYNADPTVEDARPLYSLGEDRLAWLREAAEPLDRAELLNRYRLMGTNFEGDGPSWVDMDFEGFLIARLMAEQGFHSPTSVDDEPYPSATTQSDGALLDLMEIVIYLAGAAEAARKHRPEQFTRSLRFAQNSLTTLQAADPTLRASAAPLNRLVPLNNRQMVLVKLMLVVTEAAEAAEGALKNDRENVAEELADIVVRIFHLSHLLGISIAEAFFKAMLKNLARPYQHGKSAA